MGNKLVVQAKVQQFLTSIYGTATIDSDGDFTVRRGSARGFLRVIGPEDNSDRPVFVSIFVPVLRGAIETPELHKWIAYQGNDVYGRYSLSESDDGTVDLMLTHVLLGDYLDEAEVGYAVGWIMQTADEVDEELQQKFGGRRFHEE
jgi:hypothetical protein